MSEATRQHQGITERIRFHVVPLDGVDAMTAATARAFPRHTHDQYGIGVVDAGGHASSSDRRQVEAGPGQLIFVNPGEVHDGRAIGGQPRAWRMLYLDPTTLGAALTDIDIGNGDSFRFAAAVCADERLRRHFDAAFAHVVDAQPGDAMACESAMLHLLAHVGINAATRQTPESAPPLSVQRARERIDDDPAAPLTLAMLAGESGVSRYQLLRGFTRAAGLPPHAYLLQRRIALARRLIRVGQPLAEAAHAAGFCDQGHLTRCFTRQIGVSPGRYASRAG